MAFFAHTFACLVRIIFAAKGSNRYKTHMPLFPLFEDFSDLIKTIDSIPIFLFFDINLTPFQFDYKNLKCFCPRFHRRS